MQFVRGLVVSLEYFSQTRFELLSVAKILIDNVRILCHQY